MLSLPPNLAQQVTIALVEDIGSGDVTAELVPADQRVTGKGHFPGARHPLRPPLGHRGLPSAGSIGPADMDRR